MKFKSISSSHSVLSSTSPAATFILHASIKRIDLLRKCLLILPFIGFALQMWVAPTQINAISSLLASFGSFLIFYDAFRFQRLFRYPISTIIMLGFGAVMLLTPLIITPIEGKPIVFNLVAPVLTFTHCLLIAVAAIVAHALYRNFAALQSLRLGLQGILLRMNVYEQLRIREVLPLTLLGLASSYLNREITDQVPDTPLYKFIDGFGFLASLPVVFFLQSIWTKHNGEKSKSILPLSLAMILYFLMLSLVSILVNTRSIIIAPLATLFFGLILGFIYGVVRLRISVVLGLIVSILFIFPLANDLVVAMEMARAFRGEVSPDRILNITLENLQDREAIRRYEEEVLESNRDSKLWSEVYYNNSLLNRLANIKVIDNSINLDKVIGMQGRREIFIHHIYRVISLFPAPILDLAGIPPSVKNDTIGLSWGDKHLDTALGYPVFISFRITHFSGTGMTGFGYLYLIVLIGGLLLFVFPFADSHALTSTHGIPQVPLLSLIAYSSLLEWFLMSMSNSLTGYYDFALRSFWQPVILIFVLRRIIKSI